MAKKKELSISDYTVQHCWSHEPDKLYTTAEFIKELKRDAKEQRRKLKERGRAC